MTSLQQLPHRNFNSGPVNQDIPCLANSVDPDQLKKPTDLDLHCLSFSM